MKSPVNCLFINPFFCGYSFIGNSSFAGSFFRALSFFAASLFFLTILTSCNGNISSGKGASNSSTNNPSGTGSANGGGNSDGKTAGTNPGGASSNSGDPLIDSSKLKSDMNDLINSIATGKPDTAKLKKAMSDIMNTTATVLSDSGISKLGDNSDPAQKGAQETLKSLRDRLGITPGQLDSIKKAAAQLNKN